MNDLLAEAARCRAAAVVYDNAPLAIPEAPPFIRRLFAVMAEDTKELAEALEAEHAAQAAG